MRRSFEASHAVELAADGLGRATDWSLAMTMPKAPKEPFWERIAENLPLKGNLVPYRTVD